MPPKPKRKRSPVKPKPVTINLPPQVANELRRQAIHGQKSHGQVVAEALQATWTHRQSQSGQATPIAYPGAKTKARDSLEAYFPAHCDEFREPLVGGGSVALHVQRVYGSNPNLSIWINNAYTPLYCFWKVIQDRYANHVLRDYLRNNTNGFDTAQNAKRYRDRLEADLANDRLIGKVQDAELGRPHGPTFQTMVAVAWAYWMVHRLSFSGLGASGKFSEDKWRRWLENREGDLAEYPTLIKAWKITNRPFEEVIQQPWTGKHPFLFLDPPYDFSFDTIQHERIWRRIERTAAKAENRRPRQPRKENLYGDKGDLHRDFDHGLLKRMAERRAMPWDSTGPCVMITHNDKPSLREEYQRRWTGRRWHVFDASVGYSLRSNPDYRREQKDRSEIIITNYDPFA